MSRNAAEVMYEAIKNGHTDLAYDEEGNGVICLMVEKEGEVYDIIPLARLLPILLSTDSVSLLAN